MNRRVRAKFVVENASGNDERIIYSQMTLQQLSDLYSELMSLASCVQTIWRNRQIEQATEPVSRPDITC